MLDLIGFERTPFLVFINIIMVLIAYLIYRPALSAPYKISSVRRNTGYFIILLFCLFAFWGTDWFHIAVDYQWLRQGMKSHLESLYIYLIENICPDYIMFRLIVWGVALFLYNKTIQLLNIKKDLAWACFVVIGLLWFSYARVSLAMAMMFFSFALYNSRNSLFWSKFLALLFLVGSYFCHKSALFGIVFIIVSSYAPKLNLKLLYLVLLCIPIVYFGLGYFMVGFMDMNNESDGAMGQSLVSVQGYMSRDAQAQGLGLLMQQFLERLVYILTAYIGIKAVVNKNIRSTIPNNITRLINLLFYLVVMSFIFQFDLGFNTSIMADRFFKFAFIPTSLVLAYFISNRLYTRMTSVVIVIGIFSTFYELLYSFYTSIIS